MLTFSWRRNGSRAALVLSLVVGLPAIVQAQLIPNLYTHRERNACAAEPPFYGHVRRDYFGYYPTCWRRFPEGWSCPCPNPELPDFEASKRARPLDRKPQDPPPDIDPDRDPAMQPADPFVGGGAGGDRNRRPDDSRIPPLPNDRSPFNPDNRGDQPQGRDLPPARDPAPTGPGRPNVPPANAPSGSPFDTPPGAPRVDAGYRGSYPIDRTRSIARRATPAQADVSAPTTDSGDDSSSPVLGLPEMSPPSGSLPAELPALTTLPASLPATGSFIDQAATPAASTPSTMNDQPAANQAPKRQGLISGLLGKMNSRRR